MQCRPNRFHSQATERLFLAVVNQAIDDFLANGKNAKEAERWLLSMDFVILNRLFVLSENANGIAAGEKNQRRP
jgi:hypothetical protein